VSLKQQTFSALRWTSIAMLGKAGLQFFQLIILARLLSPADFGLIALLVSIIAFVQVFSNMGVSNAIIHHQIISAQELSSLYWLNVAVGVVLMFALSLISYPIAIFYEKPELQPLLMLVSCYFLLIAIGQQLQVLAEKELQFAILAKIELIAACSGVIIALVWAFISPTVMAVIGGLLVTAFTTTVLSWLFLANGWRPQWCFRLKSIRKFLGFGGYVMANNLVSTFNQQADILIGARLISGAALGTYSLPRDLTLRMVGIINSIVTRVSLPVMAKTQDDKEFLKRVYIKTLRMTASINFPLYLSIAFFSPEIVFLLFGEQWKDAIPLLRILALWGLLRSTGNPVGSLIFAVGRADLAFKWNLSLIFIIFPSLWLGSQYGTLGIAVAQTSIMIMVFLPMWYFLVYPLCELSLKEYVLNLSVPLWISLLSVLLAYGFAQPFNESWSRLIIVLLIGATSYIILSYKFNLEMLESIQNVFFFTNSNRL
jgi:lipopolysaccharide exporter